MRLSCYFGRATEAPLTGQIEDNLEDNLQNNLEDNLVDNPRGFAHVRSFDVKTLKLYNSILVTTRKFLYLLPRNGIVH